MGELTATTFVSLDGVMQAPGGPDEDPSGGFTGGGWVIPHFDEALGRAMGETFSKAGGFLLGRGTYDIFAAHWPKVTDPGDPVAGKLNSLPKHVASRTRAAFDWSGAAHVRDVVAETPALKTRTTGELQVHGSAGLLQTLIEHDLIDEYRVIVFPVVLGAGKRLFGAGARPVNLRLVSATPTPKGVVVSIYRRGGPLATGAAPAPT